MMNRRDFLKFSSCGLTAVAIGGAGGVSLFGLNTVAHAASGETIHLTMVEADAEMVDGVVVPMWAFASDLFASSPARIPGPILFVREGEPVTVSVTNQIANGGAHGFAVPGIADTGAIPFGQTRTVTFTAPPAGTHFYLDPNNAPVNRVMGLHGALVVLPNPVGKNTPYSNPTPNVQALFDDLGTAAHFPGHPWDQDRNAIWIICTVDPNRNAQAFAHPTGIDPAVFAATSGPDRYLSQYFTINGASGFFGAQHGHGAHDGHDHSNNPDTQAQISIHGNVGQPVIIRTLNAGLMWNSLHIHGNHVYRLTDDDTVRNHLEMVDTWSMPPGMRRDVLLPYIAPPDIPANFWTRAADGINDELFPLFYPMHDHNEISNTAAGGNYPQGLATHWQIDGPVSPDDEVISIERADLRLRTGELILEGHSSRPSTPTDSLSIHAGPDATGPIIGTMKVGADGRWRFRGRALKALASRRVTVHNHVTGAERHNIPLKLR
ncbi:MAG: multicopper oxidase domain-containing protein [Desulfuromonadales bacterium]|nr:multicopper oxidase domain-containing protein [Desulfuromonadales bacterium]